MENVQLATKIQNDFQVAIYDDNVEEVERLVSEGLDISQPFYFHQEARLPMHMLRN